LSEIFQNRPEASTSDVVPGEIDVESGPAVDTENHSRENNTPSNSGTNPVSNPLPDSIPEDGVGNADIEMQDLGTTADANANANANADADANTSSRQSVISNSETLVERPNRPNNVSMRQNNK
jgi:hypothetical protein